MPYIVVNDFKAGMDTRRLPVAGTPGSSLWIINAVIGRGGDVERAKKWVAKYTLPAGGTQGIHSVGGDLYVFGETTQPSGIPAGVNYQRLEHPTHSAITKILATENFDRKAYVIAKHANGSVHHYYNGARVTDWDSLGTGRSALTLKQKMYSTAGSLLRFCALNDPTDWDTGTGNGFINFSNETGGSSDLTAIGDYQSNMAVFFRDSIVIESIDVDAANNAILYTLKQTGTRASKTVLSRGNSDLFYLDDSGVRSIRAREQTGAAYVSDVGTAIDTHLQEYMDSLTDAEIEAAVAIQEPRDGRFMLAIGERVYVFSYFPDNKISAWSYLEPPEAFTGFALVEGKLYARGADTIYLYGGDDGKTYPDANEYEVEIQLPFLDASKPADHKHITGFDNGATNVWDVDLLVDPNDMSKSIPIGRLIGITYSQYRNAAVGRFTHIAPRLRCKEAGNAVLANLALHVANMEAEE